MDIKARMQELTNELLRYQEAYYVEGKSLVSDLEYDGLFDEVQSHFCFWTQIVILKHLLLLCTIP